MSDPTSAAQARYQDPETIRRILGYARTIAVVGLSSNPGRPSYGVAQYLRDQGFQIIPVNPREAEVLGQKSYATLAEVPVPIDVVDVFRAPEFVPAVADEAIAVGARSLWLQLGVISPESAARAAAAGLDVVMDRCLKIDHESQR